MKLLIGLLSPLIAVLLCAFWCLYFLNFLGGQLIRGAGEVFGKGER